ncbi:hypothetical protein TcasGA2_TC034935, partial [Tribolium castaneum]
LPLDLVLSPARTLIDEAIETNPTSKGVYAIWNGKSANLDTPGNITPGVVVPHLFLHVIHMNVGKEQVLFTAARSQKGLIAAHFLDARPLFLCQPTVASLTPLMYLFAWNPTSKKRVTTITEVAVPHASTNVRVTNNTL